MIKGERNCSNCKSKTTYMRSGVARNRIVYYPTWFKDGNGGFYCSSCYLKKIHNPKYHPLYNPKRILFKDVRVCLDHNPRIDVCNYCRSVKPFDTSRTHMHHEQYHDSDPLRDTIELCIRCHTAVRLEMNPFEYLHIDDESDHELLPMLQVST